MQIDTDPYYPQHVWCWRQWVDRPSGDDQDCQVHLQDDGPKPDAGSEIQILYIYDSTLFHPRMSKYLSLIGPCQASTELWLAAGWQVRHTREASWRHLPEDGRQQRREAHQTGPILCQVELCHHPWISLAWKILETFTLWHPTQEFVRGCLNDTNLLQLLAPGTQWVDIQ